MASDVYRGAGGQIISAPGQLQSLIRAAHGADRVNTEVDTDSNGISSSSLRAILEGWPGGKPKPRVLYTVPVSFFLSLR